MRVSPSALADRRPLTPLPAKSGARERTSDAFPALSRNLKSRIGVDDAAIHRDGGADHIVAGA